MNSPLIIALLLFPFSLTVFAEDYYPLETGNVRYIEATPEIVGKTLVIDGKTYYEIYNPDRLMYYCRIDENGNVYRKYPDQQEELYYKLNAEEDESWIYWDRETKNIIKYEVTLVSKKKTVETKAGNFEGCFRYSFIVVPYELNGQTYYVFDANYSETIALGIGLVERASSSFAPYPDTLIKAQIGGSLIPSYPVPVSVQRTIPENGQAHIPTNGFIRIFLSLSVKPETITGNTIVVKSKLFGILTGSYVYDNMYSSQDITFYPEQPFANDDTIEVTITNGIEDYTGTHSSTSYIFSFSTERFPSLVENSKRSNPESLTLQAYPNPFNSTITLSFSLQNTQDFKLEIRSLTGQIVRSFMVDSNASGFKLFVWDGTDSYGKKVSSGAYLATLRSSEKTVSKKIMFIK